MTRRFAVATDPMSGDEEKRFKEALGDAGWWHWLPNFWLVIDSQDVLTTKAIRDVIMAEKRDVRCIVLELQDTGNWSAVTKNDANKREMAAWLKSTWRPPSDS